MDCVIGENMTCSVCGRPAKIREIRRNCGQAPKLASAEIAAIIAGMESGSDVRLSSSGGPGTELKKLLAKFGIVAMPGCSCNAMAARMDAAGPDGAEAMIDEVLGVMKQEAERRGLPWVEMAARMLVRRAIRNARARK